MDLVRQISALALVVTLSLIGLPLPIHAADEESRVVADGRALTVHGQPLWRLRNAASSAFSLASLLGQGTGQISGVAVGNDGQALAGHTVQARHVFPGGSSTVVDTTTTDAAVAPQGSWTVV